MADAILNALREPNDSEFKTPESVLEYALESVKDYEFDEFLKCIPVKEKIKVLDLEGVAQVYGFLDAKSLKIPDDKFQGVFSRVQEESIGFYDIVGWALMSDGRLKEYERIDVETEKGKERLNEIKKALDIKRLTQLEIAPVELEERLNQGFKEGKLKTYSQLKTLFGAKDFRFLKTSVVMGERKKEINAVVVLMGSNWRLIRFY